MTELSDAVAELVACKMINSDTKNIMIKANTIVDIYNNKIEAAIGIITDLVDAIAHKQEEIYDLTEKLKNKEESNDGS